MQTPGGGYPGTPKVDMMTPSTPGGRKSLMNTPRGEGRTPTLKSAGALPKWEDLFTKDGQIRPPNEDNGGWFGGLFGGSSWGPKELAEYALSQASRMDDEVLAAESTAATAGEQARKDRERCKKLRADEKRARDQVTEFQKKEQEILAEAHSPEVSKKLAEEDQKKLAEVQKQIKDAEHEAVEALLEVTMLRRSAAVAAHQTKDAAVLRSMAKALREAARELLQSHGLREDGSGGAKAGRECCAPSPQAKPLRSLQRANTHKDPDREDMMRNLRGAFDSMDMDGSGAVDLQEFMKAVASDKKAARHIQNLGLEGFDKWDEAESKRLFKQLDLDGNGEIDFSEFTQGILQMIQEQEERSGDMIELSPNVPAREPFTGTLGG